MDLTTFRPYAVTRATGDGAVMDTTLSSMSTKKASKRSAEDVAAKRLVRLAKE